MHKKFLAIFLVMAMVFGVGVNCRAMEPALLFGATTTAPAVLDSAALPTSRFRLDFHNWEPANHETGYLGHSAYSFYAAIGGAGLTILGMLFGGLAMSGAFSDKCGKDCKTHLTGEDGRDYCYVSEGGNGLCAAKDCKTGLVSMGEKQICPIK
jgi:hypothetical protein